MSQGNTLFLRYTVAYRNIFFCVSFFFCICVYGHVTQESARNDNELETLGEVLSLFEYWLYVQS